MAYTRKGRSCWRGTARSPHKRIQDKRVCQYYIIVWPRLWGRSWMLGASFLVDEESTKVKNCFPVFMSYCVYRCEGIEWTFWKHGIAKTKTCALYVWWLPRTFMSYQKQYPAAKEDQVWKREMGLIVDKICNPGARKVLIKRYRTFCEMQKTRCLCCHYPNGKSSRTMLGPEWRNASWNVALFTFHLVIISPFDYWNA